MIAVAEDRGAAVGLICPDALEDAGAVVESVGQHVDVGVVPADELAVHPDPLGLLHDFLHSATARRVSRRSLASAGKYA
jgi:hypothetical protein